MADDNQIFLDVQLDNSEAIRQGEKYIDFLEKRIKDVQKALQQALSSPVSSASQKKLIDKTLGDLRKAETDLKRFKAAFADLTKQEEVAFRLLGDVAKRPSELFTILEKKVADARRELGRLFEQGIATEEDLATFRKLNNEINKAEKELASLRKAFDQTGNEAKELGVDIRSPIQAIEFLTKSIKDQKSELARRARSGLRTDKDIREFKRLSEEIRRNEIQLRNLRKALNLTGKEQGRLSKNTEKASFSLAKFGTSLERIAARIVVSGLREIGLFIRKIAEEALEASIGIQNTLLSLQALSARELIREDPLKTFQEAFDESSERAEILLENIRRLARLSPFTRETIQSAFQTALAYGFTIVEAERLTEALVDLTSATGRGAGGLNRVALALGQIRTKGDGKAFGQELRQLSEAGVNVQEILDTLGVTAGDVSKGLVNTAEFVSTAIGIIERDFGGFAERTATTLGGITASLQDIREEFLVDLFAPAFEELRPFLLDFIRDFDTLGPKIQDAGEAIGVLISTIIDGIPTAIELTTNLLTILEEIANVLSSPGVSQMLFGSTTGSTTGLIEERVGSAQDLEDLKNVLIDIANLSDEIFLAEFIGNAHGETGLAAGEAIAKRVVEQVIEAGEGFDEFKQKLEELNEFAKEQREIGSSPLFAIGFEDEEILAFFNTYSKALEERIEEEKRLQAVLALRKLEEAEELARLEELRIRESELARVEKERIALMKDINKATSDSVISNLKQLDSFDKATEAMFKQAQTAGATGEELIQLASSLGLVDEEQERFLRSSVEAQEMLVRASNQFEKGEIEILEYARAIKLASVFLSQDFVSATNVALNQVSILNDAFSDAFASSGTSGGGGKSGFQTALEKQIAVIEQQSEALKSTVDLFADRVEKEVELAEKLEDLQSQLNEAISEGNAEKIDELTQAIAEARAESGNWGDELFDLAKAAGVSIDTLVTLGVATGKFTEEQAKAAVASVQRTEGLKAIAEALGQQKINAEEALAAAELLQQQVESGQAVDLSEFGIDVKQIDTETFPAKLDRIASRLQKVVDLLGEYTGATGSAADAQDNLTRAIKESIVQQELSQAKTLEQKLAVIEFAETLGTIDDIEKERLRNVALQEQALNTLAVAQDLGLISLAGYRDGIEQILDKGTPLLEVLENLGINIEDLPEEVQLDIITNAEEALQEIDAVSDAVDALDGKEAKVRVIVDEEGDVTAIQDTDTGRTIEARHGGYFPGDPSKPRGIFHGNELIVPDNVIKRGIGAILDFAASRIPGLNASQFMVPNDFINVSRMIAGGGGVSTTINNNSSSVSGGNRVINLSGEPTSEQRRIARALFNNEADIRHHELMRRNRDITGL